MRIDPSNQISETRVLSFLSEEGELVLRSEKKEEEGAKERNIMKLPKEEKMREFAEGLNRLFQAFDLELRFSIHKPTREIIARIVNRQTGEVIREIPPEKFLDMIAKFRELIGIFVDEIG
ncbi:MAG: flagellar protein FlaG [Candidatus Caldatribacteriaceae bacterium]